MSKQDEVMLAVTYDPAKVQLPAEVSIKLDGVAADFYRTPNGWCVQTRQGEPIHSVGHIINVLNRYKWPKIGCHIVGELTVVGVPEFKTASGIIRRREEDERIVLNVYDMYYPDKLDMDYEKRVMVMDALFADGLYKNKNKDIVWEIIRRVPVCGVAHTIEEISQHLSSMEKMLESSPSFEGFMVRCLHGEDSLYRVGKRSRNMMRYKPKPTVDLEVVSFEEATANKTMTFLGDVYSKGEGLGAVGRINCLYKGEIVGVGPGTLTHVERRDLWNRYKRMKHGGGTFTGSLIAEVEYMLDSSYTALRQPVFKRWRTDKQEASEVA